MTRHADVASIVRVSHRCGARNWTIPGYCDRRLADPNQRYCWEHSQRRLSAPPHTTARTALRSTPLPSPRPPSPSEKSGRGSPKRELQVSTKAIEVAQDVITEGWRAATAAQISQVLNDAFWRTIPRRKRKRPDCQALADIAAGMEAAIKAAHNAVGAMASKGLDWLGRPTLERRVAEEFAKKIPLPGEAQIKETVRTLRICGIVMCMINDRDVFTECPCFRSLAKDMTRDALKEALVAKLDILVQDSQSRR
jgi:hypothetical protein